MATPDTSLHDNPCAGLAASQRRWRRGGLGDAAFQAQLVRCAVEERAIEFSVRPPRGDGLPQHASPQLRVGQRRPPCEAVAEHERPRHAERKREDRADEEPADERPGFGIDAARPAFAFRRRMEVPQHPCRDDRTGEQRIGKIEQQDVPGLPAEEQNPGHRHQVARDGLRERERRERGGHRIPVSTRGCRRRAVGRGWRRAIDAAARVRVFRVGGPRSTGVALPFPEGWVWRKGGRPLIIVFAEGGASCRRRWSAQHPQQTGR